MSEITDVIRAFRDDETFRVQDILEYIPDTDKATVRKAFSRLCEHKYIVRVSHGLYRKVTKPIPIDIEHAQEVYLDLELPLQLNNLVQVTPRSVIVVGGVPNSGKSAFLLNVIRHNMHKREDIDYFSSELNDTRLKIRLNRFEDVEEAPINWRFGAFEMAGDYASFINPDGITIIDYLEVYDNFYLVSKYINDIFRVLKTGVAFIALQKNSDAQYAIGGTRSAEKPHLYLTLDNNSMTIVKAKDWKNPMINPNNMKIDFKLVQGAKFVPVGKWYRMGTKQTREQKKEYMEVF